MKYKQFSLSALLFASTISFAESTEGLSQKLDELRIPDAQVTPLVSKDQLYIINSRYSSLINRHEFTFMGAHNLTADSHLDNKNLAATYRYHINSDWSLGARYNYYSNTLTTSGQTLFDNEQIFPNTDFALNSKELFVNYNTVYGKVRLSETNVAYFDQYISLGGGSMELASGNTAHGILDLGLAFWVGKYASLRVGLRNEFYNQTLFEGTRFKANSMGYLELGILFGSGDRS